MAYGSRIKGVSFVNEVKRLNCVRISKNDWKYNYNSSNKYILAFDKPIYYVCFAPTQGIDTFSIKYTTHEITVEYRCTGTYKANLNDELSYIHFYIWYFDNTLLTNYGMRPPLFNTSRLGNTIIIKKGEKRKITAPYIIDNTDYIRYNFDGNYLTVINGDIKLREIIINNSKLDDYGIFVKTKGIINASIKSEFELRLKKVESELNNNSSNSFKLEHNERLCLMPYPMAFVVMTQVGTKGGVGFYNIILRNNQIYMQPNEELMRYAMDGFFGMIMSVRFISFFSNLLVIKLI